MRLKLSFSSNIKPIGKPLNEEVNGFLNNILGEGNKYHGTFSRYSVSSMQGGHMDKNGIINFPDGGYVFISSDDYEFIANVLKGLSSKQDDLYVFDMKYQSMVIDDFSVNEKFDLVRAISPVIISENGKFLTFKDEHFFKYLTSKSIKKLINCGYDEKLANTLSIEPFHPEKFKTKMVEIKGKKNIASRVMFFVTGDKTIRKAIYELGIGKCTGFGFGAVNINNKI